MKFTDEIRQAYGKENVSILRDNPSSVGGFIYGNSFEYTGDGEFHLDCGPWVYTKSELGITLHHPEKGITLRIDEDEFRKLRHLCEILSNFPAVV